jgi:hypothetical protein
MQLITRVRRKDWTLRPWMQPTRPIAQQEEESFGWTQGRRSCRFFFQKKGPAPAAPIPSSPGWRGGRGGRRGTGSRARCSCSRGSTCCTLLCASACSLHWPKKLVPSNGLSHDGDRWFSAPSRSPPPCRIRSSMPPLAPVQKN